MQGYYWEEDEVKQKLKKIMIQALNNVLEKKKQYDLTMRSAAYILSVVRVVKTMKSRHII